MGVSAEAEKLVELNRKRPSVKAGKHGLGRREVDIPFTLAWRDVVVRCLYLVMDALAKADDILA